MNRSDAHATFVRPDVEIIYESRLHEEGEEDGKIEAEAPIIASTNALKPEHTIWRLTCFFGLLGVLAFSMNALVSSGLRGITTSSYGAWNQVMQGKVNAEVIISGSSRATYHYDPRTIEAASGKSAFNIGRVGTQTDIEVAVLKAYLEHNRKPELILHNLDAFSFVPTREIYDPALYVPYLGDKEIFQPLLRIDRSFVKSRYIPLYGYVVEDMNFTWLLGLKSFFGIQPKQDFFLGFCPRDKTWTDDFDNFRAGNPNGVSFAVNPAGVQALEELIEVCKRNGIQLVFVYSPEYTGMQAMTNNRAEIFARFRDLASHNHIPLWDYSDSTYSGDRDLFYNSQHLNAKGALLFSNDVASRVKAYLANKSEARSELQNPGKGNYATRNGN